MKTPTLALALSALALMCAGAPELTIWKTVAPREGARPVKLSVEGKTLTYYALDGDGASVRLKGPTRLRAYVRGHFEEKMPANVEISVRIAMDGKDLDARKLSCRRSKSSTYAENGHGSAPGARSTITLDVPEGEHTFQFRSDAPANASFSRATKQKRSLRTEMTPAEFEKAVEEIFEERERTWYFSTKDKPVAMDVVGPTTLDIYASLTFDASMRTETEYKVEVVIDGAVALEKSFKAARSHVRTYPDEKTLVPGQQDDFKVKMPDGKHRVEFRPKGEQSVAFRIFMPSKDLKNGGK
ncbi:MAG: hypothetical protein HYY18_01045 [Planctomycetes bacterium]|nr:hypothetical protein [Planctomycetota bacterium]